MTAYMGCIPTEADREVSLLELVNTLSLVSNATDWHPQKMGLHQTSRTEEGS